MNIKENIAFFLNEIESLKPKNQSCKLLAVSKTQPLKMLEEAYLHGTRIFAENKVQELATKYEALPKDIEWHLIGHLQSNKVKYIAPFVSLVHSVDSLKLLEEINKQALKNGRIIDCLLQIYIAQEETKFGLSSTEAIGIFESPEFKDMKGIKITGLMGMASNTTNQTQIRKEFKSLKTFFDELCLQYPPTDNINLKEISMGMSSDYRIAIEEGSTMIRIGSAIFGERIY